MCIRGLSQCLLFAASAFWLAPEASAAVAMDWVAVGDSGNACDTQPQGCFGGVAYEYRISKHEVTNTQYAVFLNAVADTDLNGLYHENMGSGFGGISQSGSSGSYTYSTIAGRGDMPVNYVSFWNALRFANWLHNNQPEGGQSAITTEDGAYTITAPGISNNSITRNPGAQFFLPSEDEWYKAAYYDAASMIYFDYPAGSDVKTTCALAGPPSNTANCNLVAADLTPVGSYTGSASPSGTFDQGGNVWEWNETIIGTTKRGWRGGEFGFFPAFLDLLNASERSDSGPGIENVSVGFRVASPALIPPVPALNSFGMALLWTLLGIGGWRALHRKQAVAGVSPIRGIN